MPHHLLFAGFAAAVVTIVTWVCIARGRLLHWEDHVTRAEYTKRFWFSVVSRAIAGVFAVWVIAACFGV